MQLLPKFDAHMHIGKAYKSIMSGNFQLYIDNALLCNITQTVAIPPCIPDYRMVNGRYQIPFLTQKCEDGIYYYKESIVNGRPIRESIISDPFFEINRFTFNIVNECKWSINVHFAPIVHPIFFDFTCFSEKEWQKIVAVKIHPGSFGVNISDIPNDFLKKIEKNSKTLILHTGYKNSIAYEWIKRLYNYNINVLFTHACRLDSRCIKIINTDCRYFVGTAPYKRLSVMNNFQNTTNFLQSVFELFDIEHIVFDTDYPENYDITNAFYWDFESELNLLNISTENANKFFNENALKLFDFRR